MLLKAHLYILGNAVYSCHQICSSESPMHRYLREEKYNWRIAFKYVYKCPLPVQTVSDIKPILVMSHTRQNCFPQFFWQQKIIKLSCVGLPIEMFSNKVYETYFVESI